jgi:hypothetical protein
MIHPAIGRTRVVVPDVVDPAEHLDLPLGGTLDLLKEAYVFSEQGRGPAR